MIRVKILVLHSEHGCTVVQLQFEGNNNNRIKKLKFTNSIKKMPGIKINNRHIKQHDCIK
jgi:hypothetical protein